MQIQPLTWQAFLLQLLLSLGPAAIALTATYITLRHQRKLKADELTISSTLKARELMFGVYTKRLDRLYEQSVELGNSVGKLQISLHAAKDKEETLSAASDFFSALYSNALQMPDFVEEIEAELTTMGLREKFADNINFAKTIVKNQFRTIPSGDSKAEMNDIVQNLLKAVAFLITMQRAIVEAKADELFRDYLPTVDKTLVKR